MSLNYYSGLSGINLPIPKYKFPDDHSDSSRLTYYSTFFNSIEINSSFYKLPLQKTISKWTTMVPDNFKFTFKLWQEITHAKQLAFKESDVEKYFDAISAAGHKNGCVLIQFPPSQGAAQILEFNSLLSCIRDLTSGATWQIAVEFRNRSWYEGRVYDILQAHNAALVVHDLPKSRPPYLEHQAKAVYLRFHGPTGNYRESYTDSFLAEYATYIHEWLSEGKTVYAYFNNTMGDAFNNLHTLNNLVYGRI